MVADRLANFEPQVASDGLVVVDGLMAVFEALKRPSVELEIVIPALNEGRRLIPTLERTIEFLAGRDWSSALVVVDNGSVDDTADVARRFRDSEVPVYLIGCSRPGKGAAIRRGLLTSRATYVGFMDADLSTDLDALDAAISLLRKGQQVVVGSRYITGSQITIQESPIRRLGGAVFRKVASRAVDSVADTQCGFKFLQGDLGRAVAKAGMIDGFAFDVEMLALVQRHGIEVTEVPVTWDWHQSSTFRIYAHGVRTFADAIGVVRSKGLVH